jgi:hypothetical protein
MALDQCICGIILRPNDVLSEAIVLMALESFEPCRSRADPGSGERGEPCASVHIKFIVNFKDFFANKGAWAG